MSDVPLQAPSAQMPDAYYDLHLAGVTPERPLTLDEAKPKIVSAIKDERARAALAAKAEEIRTKIADALKTGKPFADAAKDAGQTIQDVPAFSQIEPYPHAAGRERDRRNRHRTGQRRVEQIRFHADGGMLVYVRGREAVDQTKFDLQKDRITSALRQQKAGLYFSEWLRASREAANVQIDQKARG